ncbi:MAG: neutral zinc metallopeptidase [Thermomicrobiales bacterium]|nr:neutral zinc metallopeptidase [Thermomicrobiales bacterium]
MVKRFLFAAMVLLLSVSVPLASGSAQTDTVTARDQAQVAMAVNNLFEMAGALDYNGLYDAMHPDSQNVISRTVALNLFNDVYSRVVSGQSQIVGMEFGQWTWEVKGTTYPNAVVVNIVQQVLDENNKPTWVEDRIFLANDGAAWRWFISDSSDFIDQVNSYYAGASAPESGSSTTSAVPQVTNLNDVPRDQIFQVVVNDLDAFYRDVLSYTDFIYESPGVVVVAAGDSVMSACGPASTGFYGFYCPLDSTMYLDEPFLLDMVDQGNAFAAAFVIAHEWAHHVQTSIGLERTTRPDAWNEVHSIELELMADCFSGVWARDAELRGLVDPGDIESAINDLVFSLGDPKFIGEYDPQAHGNGQQRVRATLNGYEQGFTGCNLSI